MRALRGWIGLGGAFLFLLLPLLFIFGLSTICSFIPQRIVVSEVHGEVVDKYVKRYNDSDIFHVVVQKVDGSTEVLQNRDAIWWGKFRSADLQQELKIGSTHTFTVVGWRIGVVSSFRNIVKVDGVTSP